MFSRARPIPYRTIPDCMDAVDHQEVDLAVVPVENALEGSVNITLDYLTQRSRNTDYWGNYCSD